MKAQLSFPSVVLLYFEYIARLSFENQLLVLVVDFAL